MWHNHRTAIDIMSKWVPIMKQYQNLPMKAYDLGFKTYIAGSTHAKDIEYFSETVEPRFSQVTLQGPDGQTIGVPAFTPSANGKTLTIPLPNLPPGDYRVSWRVISVDTHRTEGRFTFTVRP